MAISPALAEDLAKIVLEAYLRGEITMLEQVARRLGRGVDRDGWAESKLAETQQLRRQVQAELDRLTGEAARLVDEQVQAAYNRGVAAAGTDLRAVGVSRELAFATVDVPERVVALAAQTVGALEGVRLPALRSVMDGYRDIIAQTSTDVLTGTVTRRQAAQRALDQFARRGVTGFRDAAGRNWELASYSEMATRTATGRAAVEGHMDRLLQNGLDLVIVSDAPQECEICRVWEGKVLSISGQTSGTVRAENLRSDTGGTVTVAVAGTVEEARAAGLFHPNCRHSMSLFQPGVTRPRSQRETADPQGDADRQRLREMERNVRSWKRREAVALTDEDRRKAAAKVRTWQGEIRTHTERTSVMRQRAREQIGSAR